MNVEQLKKSLQVQKEHFDNSLILNPVENVPFPDIISPCSGFLHGLYNTDTLRDDIGKINSKIQFSGRDLITRDTQWIYSEWARLLGAEKVSMRLLSGLHAHIILFMGLSSIGDRVMVLPEKAGGHLSGVAILNRLGLKVEEIPYDSVNMCVDKEKFWKKYNQFHPDIIFVDRSEGLVYEDFTWMGQAIDCYKIFDASQYLTNIVCKDYKNPFNMGFDLIISTMHKNLPGPQRAFIASRKADKHWNRLSSSISTYVSNMHVFSIYSAGLLLDHMEELEALSSMMLENAILLDQYLKNHDVPIIHRNTNLDTPPTHHCWICVGSKEKAFALYHTLENLGILTNYRLLPYDIGYGLRLGLSGATMSGLRVEHIPALSEIIAEAYKAENLALLHAKSRKFIYTVKKREF